MLLLKSGSLIGSSTKSYITPGGKALNAAVVDPPSMNTLLAWRKKTPSCTRVNPQRESGNAVVDTGCRTKSGMRMRKAAGLTAGLLVPLLIMCVCVILPAAAFAGQVTLAWDQNDPVPDSYKLFARLEGKQYDYKTPIWSGSATSATINNLQDNTTYYFVVRAVMGDNESGNSNEVDYSNNIVVSTPPATNTDTGADVIIDNGATGTSTTGSWKISGGSNPYGSDSMYSKDIGADYTYTSNISGRYDVALWWTSYSSRCSSVPVKIYNGSTLLDKVTINQSQNGGKWNLLGSYNFTGRARVVVSAQYTYCSTCADAVEFAYNTSSGSTSATDGSTGTASGSTGTASGSTGTASGSTGTVSGSTGTASDSTGTVDSTNDPSSGDATQDTSDVAASANDVGVKVIDDGDQGTSSTGNWSMSGGSNPYGSGSVYSKDVGASYTYASDLTGRYDVALWWSSYSSRCSDVPIEIYDGYHLLDTVSVNQSQNGGKWNTVGSYDFTGKARVVVVSSYNSCSTSADAVEFSVDVGNSTSNDTSIVTSVTSKVIDEGDQGTSSTGSWKISGGFNPYGSESLYSKDVGASYAYTSRLTGRYEVALWWSSYSSRCTDVPIKIYDGNRLLDTVSINQGRNGGKWNALGNYYFSGQARVVVVVQDSNCSTCADAVSFSE